MNGLRVSSFVFFLAVLLGFSLSPAFAQKITGDISGTVTDSSGAALPNATVTAVCSTTGAKRTTTTSQTGSYGMPEMAVCVYKVSASAQGFKTTERNVQVAIGLLTTADFVLQVGQRTDTITVESAAPLIEYSPDVNNYVDQERIVDLPFSGRDFNSLLGITPGVQRAPGGGFLAVNISGARRTSNNYLLDGIYNNDRYYGDALVGQTGVVGIPAVLVSLDAIQEFSVQQLPSAEYGIKGGAPINVGLKSGGNAFHGSAYYFGHSEFTDAQNVLVKQVTPIKNHQYGGTLGGPLVKDRTFFFGYFEGQRNNSIPPFTVAVPTQPDVDTARALDCGLIGQGPTCALPGDALLAFFPKDPSGRISSKSPISAKMSSFGVKIDHKISEKHQLSGRYFFGDSVQSAPAVGYTISPPPPAKADIFNSVAPSRGQLLGVSWTYTISPNKILESRFGWARFSQILDVNNKIDPKSLGIDTGPLDPSDFGVPYVNAYAFGYGYNYIGGVGGYPITTRPDQTYDQSEHFTWIKGKHTMKMGGNWQFAETQSLRNRARSRLSVYGYYDPVINLQQILLLRFDQAVRSFGDTKRHLVQHTFGFYWSDEWKVKPRLTLTLGIRYEINGALGESNNLGGNFFVSQGLVPLGPNLNRIYNRDFHDFGPRAGLAWDIFGNGKTALRLGYSLTYDVPNFGSIHAPRAIFSRNQAGAYTNPTQGNFSVRLNGSAANPITGTPSDCVFTTAGANPTGSYICGGIDPATGMLNPLYGPNNGVTPPFNVFAVTPDLKTPRYHYYSLGIQHQVFSKSVLTVSYVGSLGQNLLMYRDLNARPIGCRFGGVQQTTQVNPTGLDCRRPFETAFPNAVAPALKGSDILSVTQLTNDSKSWYNSLQVSFRQQAWHGINTQYNFTWSHCTDYNSINRGTRSNASPAQNPYNPAANKGNCDFDVPRNFNIAGVYQFPKVSKLRRFGEGWEMGTVVTALDGRPFSLLASSDRTGQDDRAPNHKNCAAAPIYHPRDPTNYISNGAAFTNPASNLIGTCGRNVFRGPGLIQWDLSLTKLTKVTERLNVQFRWEVFNVANRANYSAPTGGASGVQTIATTPDAFVGNPVIAQGAPRNMQFVLKFIF